jgi:hypothetical protein
MVISTASCEVGELGRSTLGIGDLPVVDLELPCRATAGYDTDRVASLESGADGGRDHPSDVGHACDVDTVCDHQLQECLAEDLAGDGDRDGPDAGDLAHLSRPRLAAAKGGEVDVQHHL